MRDEAALREEVAALRDDSLRWVASLSSDLRRAEADLREAVLDLLTDLREDARYLERDFSSAGAGEGKGAW